MDRLPNPVKKNTASDHGSEDDGKRTRGRPRVESVDETASARRRTQIRLAQRAYRLRKETTISSLRQRVTELKGTVNAVNSTFFNFYNSAVASGLAESHPMLAQQLQEAAEHIGLQVQLARLDTAESEEGVPPPESGDSSEQTARQEGSSHDLPVPGFERRAVGPTIVSPYSRGVPSVWGYELLPARPQPSDDGQLEQQASVESMSWRRPRAQQQQQQQQPQPQPQPPRQGLQHLQHQQYGLGQHGQQQHQYQHQHQQSVDEDMSTSVSDSGSSTQIPAPAPWMHSTYLSSVHEVTFGRRLHRASLETALDHLSSRNPNVKLLKQKFELIAPFMSLAAVREKLKLRLWRNLADPPLEANDNVQLPFSHLGGAGLHYPVKLHSFLKVKDTPMTIGRVHSRRGGEATFVPELLQEHDDGGWPHDTVINKPFYSGKWFDPYDVEGYLEECGIFIDPNASHADFEMTPNNGDTTITNTTATATTPTTVTAPPFSTSMTSPSHEQSKPWHTMDLDNDDDDNVDNAAGEDLFDPTSSDLLSQELLFDLSMLASPSPVELNCYPDTSNHSSDTNLSDGLAMSEARARSRSGSGATGQETAIPTVKEGTRQRFTLDVKRFTAELVRRAICLGRSPGYRQKDVDRAIRLAAAAVC